MFNEEESWPWDDSYIESVQASLDWSDTGADSHHDGKNEATNNSVGDLHEENSKQHTLEEHIIVDPVVDPSNDPAAVLISKLAEKRSRNPPTWMRDYGSGENLSDDDDQGNFALFVYQDPLTYVDAAKSANWRCAMDSKIEAIRKNDTWDLTDLPHGAKIIKVLSYSYVFM